MTRRHRRRGGGSGDYTEAAQSAYDATATFGLFMAFLKAIGGTLIAIVIILISVWLIRLKDAYEGKTTGKVTASRCNTKDAATSCTIDYEYTVDGKKYTGTNYKIQGTYVVGSSLNTLYDRNNPDNHKIEPVNWRFIGWIGVAIGVVLFFSVWIWFFVARTFKIAAAASGVGAFVEVATKPGT